MSLNLSETEFDDGLKDKLSAFHDSIAHIEGVLDVALAKNCTELEDSIQLDLFLAYALNTLFWMYCKAQNVDPNTLDVKKDLQRVRDNMIIFKKSQERKTIRPNLNVPVAERIIRHGTKIHKKRAHSDQNEKVNESKRPKSSKSNR